jgi:hypothetical protein
MPPVRFGAFLLPHSPKEQIEMFAPGLFPKLQGR